MPAEWIRVVFEGSLVEEVVFFVRDVFAISVYWIGIIIFQVFHELTASREGVAS